MQEMDMGVRLGWWAIVVLVIVGLILVRSIMAARHRSAAGLVASLGILLAFVAVGGLVTGVYSIRQGESPATALPVTVLPATEFHGPLPLVATSETVAVSQWPGPMVKSAKSAGEITGEIPVEVSAAAEGPKVVRPAWVDQKPHRQGRDYITTVKVGPYATIEECRQALPAELRRVVERYSDEWLDSPGAGRRAALPMSYIQDEIVTQEWITPHQSEYFATNGMLWNYAQLRFDDDDRRLIQRRFHDAAVAERLGYTGAWSGMVLLLIGTLFGYLKLDTATKGYYTGRLKLAAAATILAGSAATAMLVYSLAS